MSADELITRSKAALAAWDCVHVVASIDVMATDIPDTIERAYREAPGIVRDLVHLFEKVHEWGHARDAEVDRLLTERENQNTFTFSELRITLTAFATWLGRVNGIEVVDRFLAESTADEAGQ